MLTPLGKKLCVNVSSGCIFRRQLVLRRARASRRDDEIVVAEKPSLRRRNLKTNTSISTITGYMLAPGQLTGKKGHGAGQPVTSAGVSISLMSDEGSLPRGPTSPPSDRIMLRPGLDRDPAQLGESVAVA